MKTPLENEFNEFTKETAQSFLVKNNYVLVDGSNLIIYKKPPTYGSLSEKSIVDYKVDILAPTSYHSPNKADNILKVEKDLEVDFYKYWVESCPAHLLSLLHYHSGKICSKYSKLKYYKEHDFEELKNEMKRKESVSVSITTKEELLILLNFFFSLDIEPNEKVAIIKQYCDTHKSSFKRIEAQNMLLPLLKNNKADYTSVLPFIPDVVNENLNVIYQPSACNNILKLNKKNLFSLVYNATFNDKVFLTRVMFLLQDFYSQKDMLKKLGLLHVFLHKTDEKRQNTEYIMIFDFKDPVPNYDFKDLSLFLIKKACENNLHEVYPTSKNMPQFNTMLDYYLLDRKILSKEEKVEKKVKKL